MAGTRNRRLSAATTEFLNKRVKDTDALPRQSSDRDHLAEAASSVQSRLLNEFMATGICGNNITSSCLCVLLLVTSPPPPPHTHSHTHTPLWSPTVALGRVRVCSYTGM